MLRNEVIIEKAAASREHFSAIDHRARPDENAGRIMLGDGFGGSLLAWLAEVNINFMWK